MTRESCIQHAPKTRSVIIKGDYLAICANDHCAAALLGLIEFWANGAIASDANPPQKIKLGEFTSKELHWWLLGFYSTKRIMERITMLKNRGWISYKESANHKSRTYWANISTIQAALDKRQMFEQTPDKCLPQTIVLRQMSEQTPDKCLDKTLPVQTNVSTTIYSNSLSNSSFSKESEGEKERVGEKIASLEGSGSSTNPLFFDQPNQPSDSKDSNAIRESKSSASRDENDSRCDNSAFVGSGNLAPDGKRRPFNQMSGKWASVPSDPWMNNQNPIAEFKQWVCQKAIASGRSYSIADAAGEIRNNFQRAGDLWEEYQASLAPKPSTTPQVSYEPLPEKKCWLPPVEEREAFKKQLLTKKAGLS